MPPTREPTCKPAGGEEGRLKNLAGGARAEMEERWSGQEFLGQGKKESFHQSRQISSLVCCGLAVGKNHVPVFSRVKRDWAVLRKIMKKGKVALVRSILIVRFMSVLDKESTRKYLPINV